VKEPRSTRVRAYLGHIIEAIERITRYVGDGDRTRFLHDEKTQDAVLRNREISGEAARNVERVSPRFASDHPEIPWSVIYAMRNRVSHAYFAVDLSIVWQTVQTDLPMLEQQVRRLLETVSDSSPIWDTIGYARTVYGGYVAALLAATIGPWPPQCSP